MKPPLLSLSPSGQQSPRRLSVSHPWVQLSENDKDDVEDPRTTYKHNISRTLPLQLVNCRKVKFGVTTKATVDFKELEHGCRILGRSCSNLLNFYCAALVLANCAYSCVDQEEPTFGASASSADELGKAGVAASSGTRSLVP